MSGFAPGGSLTVSLVTRYQFDPLFGVRVPVESKAARRPSKKGRDHRLPEPDQVVAQESSTRQVSPDTWEVHCCICTKVLYMSDPQDHIRRHPPTVLVTWDPAERAVTINGGRSGLDPTHGLPYS